MKRLSKSDIEKRKQGQIAPPETTAAKPGEHAKARVAETPRDSAAVPDAEPPSPPPAVDFAKLLNAFKESVDEYQLHAPHVRAFRELRAEQPAGADLLSSRAAELFEQVRREFTDDPLALHHLAIIYHGTGYQLHFQRDKVMDAVPHWRKGVQAWAELVKNNDFWEGLKQRWDARCRGSRTDMLAQRLLRVDLQEFRRQIPRHLLEVHAEIIIENFQTNPRVAREHMGIVRESGFEATEIDAARKRVYSRLIGTLDEYFAEFAFAKARDVIARFLEIDPDNLQALRDALRTCCAECQHLGIGGNRPDERLRIVQACAARALHPELVARARTDMLTAECLRNFYCEWAAAALNKGDAFGDAASAQRWQTYLDAAEKGQAAVGFERCGDKARKLLHLICWNGAVGCLNARGSALTTARELVERGLSLNRNDAGMTALRAYLLLREGRAQEFQSELQRAAQLNVSQADPSAASLIATLLEASRDGIGNPRRKELFDRAENAMQRQSYREALGSYEALLAEGADLGSDNACYVCFAMAVCQLHLGELVSARRSFARARELVHSGTPQNLRESIDTFQPLLG